MCGDGFVTQSSPCLQFLMTCLASLAFPPSLQVAICVLANTGSSNGSVLCPDNLGVGSWHEASNGWDWSYHTRHLCRIGPVYEDIICFTYLELEMEKKTKTYQSLVQFLLPWLDQSSVLNVIIIVFYLAMVMYWLACNNMLQKCYL